MPVRNFSTAWEYYRPACLTEICIESTTILGQFATFSILAFERRNSLLFQLNRSKKWSRLSVIIVLILTWKIISLYNVAVTIFSADVPEGSHGNMANYYPASSAMLGFLAY